MLLARWLITEPRLLILDEPTRGIDIGAKAQIQKLVAQLSADGMAVVFISAELEEVLRLCHRVAVLRDRRMVAQLANDRGSPGRHHGTIASGAPGVKGHDRGTASSGPWWRCWPLLLVNLVVEPRVLRDRLRDGHLYGSLIDILRNGAPLMLVALGMTLVIATRGIDLSVGAVVAIAGAVACPWIADPPDGAGVPARRGGLALGLALVLGRLERLAGRGARDPADHRHPGPDGGRPRHRPADHRRPDHHHQPARSPDRRRVRARLPSRS